MEYGAMRQFVASPIFIANSTSFLFRTGSTPGIPRHTGQTFEFGEIAEFRRASAKCLRLRQHLRVNFKTDYSFVFIPIQFSLCKVKC